jgi:hypothetical protein
VLAWIGVEGCGQFISLRVTQRGQESLVLWKYLPTLASVAEARTLHFIKFQDHHSIVNQKPPND